MSRLDNEVYYGFWGLGEVSLAVGAASAALESWGVLRALKRVSEEGYRQVYI